MKPGMLKIIKKKQRQKQLMEVVKKMTTKMTRLLNKGQKGERVTLRQIKLRERKKKVVKRKRRRRK